MSTLLQLRRAAREIFDAALQASDAGQALSKAIQFDGATISIGDVSAGNRCVYAIAFGKAALAMARALDRILGKSLTGAVLVNPRSFTRDQEIPLGKPWMCTNGGHPLPTRDSFLAAEQVLELLDRANSEHALVIFLVSGGGSALMEWPISSEITLANIRIATKALIACGASIGDINAVRRAFSAVKGGKLAVRAPNCQQLTLIVSDVPKGREHDVASGPTLTPPADAPAAVEVIDRYGLRDQMPPSIMQAIEDSEMSDRSTPTNHRHLVLLDNDAALEAAEGAARRREFTTEIARDISDERIELGAERLLTHLLELRRTNGDVCLISGGEFACPVRGDGMGGRNLETALRLAIGADGNRDHLGEFVALCAGTDGIDGNSPAAGAIVDSTTIDRARRIGLDPLDFLNRSDAYSFFVALGDVITTGPTGTNVRDLRILLA